MGFLDWLSNHKDDDFTDLLVEKDEFNGTNEMVSDLREEYHTYLKKNPDYVDDQQGFEDWLDPRNGMSGSINEKDNDESDHSSDDNDQDDECTQTYGEFLDRTGVEDTEQNYQKFRAGYSDIYFD